MIVAVIILSSLLLLACLVETALIHDRASPARVAGLFLVALWGAWRLDPRSPPVNHHDVLLLVGVCLAAAGGVARGLIERRRAP